MGELDEATLDALMAQLARGERAAFDPLFAALHRRALSLARARLDASTAADVAQTALLKLFSRAHEFTPGRSALAWFYAIVANEVRGAQRGARPYTALEDHALAHPEPNPEQQLQERELARALSCAMRELDPQASEAIAALLGDHNKPSIEPAAFRKRVSRAYARLRILLGDLR